MRGARCRRRRRADRAAGRAPCRRGRSGSAATAESRRSVRGYRSTTEVYYVAGAATYSRAHARTSPTGRARSLRARASGLSIEAGHAARDRREGLPGDGAPLAGDLVGVDRVAAEEPLLRAEHDDLVAHRD